MRETRQSGSEGGEGSLPDPYHVFVRGTQDVDGRHKGGHDVEKPLRIRSAFVRQP
jgi:hypothetical protein